MKISVSYGVLDTTFTGSWRGDGTFSGGWRPNRGAHETVNVPTTSAGTVSSDHPCKAAVESEGTAS